MNTSPEIDLCRYYVNKTARENGMHQVHKSDCNILKSTKTYIDLGIHMNCHSAIIKAMDYFQQSNCCYCCTGDCKPN